MKNATNLVFSERQKDYGPSVYPSEFSRYTYFLMNIQQLRIKNNLRGWSFRNFDHVVPRDKRRKQRRDFGSLLRLFLPLPRSKAMANHSKIYNDEENGLAKW